MMDGFGDVPTKRCPLCFKVLDEHERLIRLCPSDPRMHGGSLLEEFECTPGNLREKIHCWRPECREKIGLPEGVFLLHVGCVARHPFWRREWDAAGGGEIEIPTEEQGVFAAMGDGTSRRVGHWEIGMLREAARIPGLAARSEMWFPNLLLRAGFECVAGRRLGTLVKLSGSKSVGKTILATMALLPYNLGGRRCLGHFVYLRPRLVGGEQPEEPFLQALSPLERLTVAGVEPGAKGDWFPPSTPADLNLKALFLERDPECGSPGARSSVEKPGGTGLFGRLMRPVKEALRPAVPRVADDDGSRKAYDAVLFYDTAGEESQRGESDRIRHLDECMDVVAVLVDVTDLRTFERFKNKGERKDALNSVPVAVERLSRVANKRASRCLIVTKLDLVNDQTVADALVEATRSPGSEPAGEREFFAKWLETSSAAGGLTPYQERLAQMVRNPHEVHRVFFIWTENAHNPEVFPKTHGMVKFIAWCRSGARPEAPAKPSKVGVSG
jgi:hypothetical protein